MSEFYKYLIWTKFRDHLDAIDSFLAQIETETG